MGRKFKKFNRKKNTPKNLTGVISIASNGIGYVEIENLEKDVQIQNQFLNTAFHGDLVEIAILPKKNTDIRTQAEVIKILKRAKDEFVGTIDRKKQNRNFAFVIPDNPHMYSDIFIPEISKKDIKHNTKVLVKITNWGQTDSRYPKKNLSGKIIKILGKKGSNETEMQSILIENNHELDFPNQVKRQARKIQSKARINIEKESSFRKDYTKVPTFTIDPAESKDMDDALSIQKINNDLFEVGIHVADVSFYVKENSELDLCAKKKGNSVYLVDRTMPMFPEELTNDVCSLNPKEKKLTFSVILKIDKQGTIKERWFGKTMIYCNKRFSYKKAQEAIDSKDEDYSEELQNLNIIANNLRKEREENGALILEQTEIEFDLDANGKPISICKKEILPTHKLIEEFMILANREIADYFNSKKKNNLSVFRIHETPKKGKVNDLLQFLNTLNYNIDIPKKIITSKEINKILKRVEEEDKKYLLEKVIMQDMEKAIYSLENKGHYGLALKNYTHFTSPIRRYADLIVHRILEGYLKNNPVKGNRLKYKKTIDNLNQREIDAMEAERTSVKYKQVEYMLERKGKIFDGIIASILNWGIFVQEKDTKTEGLIKTRDLKDDFYKLDEKNYSLIGTRTGKKYSVGDKVRIQVADGDLNQKTLEYRLVSDKS